MWRLARRVAQVEQEGRYGVGDDRALRAQHLVSPYLDAPDLEHVLELRSVLDLYLQEQDPLLTRDVVVLALLPLLPGVLLLGAAAAAVGDEVYLTPPRRLFDEPLAVSSTSIRSCRSSVERWTRDTSEMSDYRDYKERRLS